jgi:hypothetical protein
MLNKELALKIKKDIDDNDLDEIELNYSKEELSEDLDWYRKREDFLEKVTEDFGSHSAVVIPKCAKWMSINTNIIIEIRDALFNPK